jgi:hypothetical protein
MKRRAIIHLFVVVSILLMALPASSTAQEGKEPQYHIALKSRQFIPSPGVEPALAQELGEERDGRRHVLLQLEDIPTDAQRAALEAAGVRLLGYIPNNAWFASLPVELSPQNSSLSQVRWMGAIQAADRISPILREGGVRQDMIDEQGQTNLEIRFFPDVSPDEALRVLGAHEATVETKLIDFHRFVVRVDAGAIDALAEEDSVQWITEASPPKTTYNDGIRARTNVDAVQSVPYNLSGSGVDLGIWDSGTVDDHVDFAGRLTVVDGASVGDHATHVAGTMAGDGSNSASQGGTALQWRGMATGADIISYYWDNNLTDHNGAINTYGIELSQNSWGYTIGEVWPGNCYLYGDYDGGAPDYDDIITGLYGKRIAVVFAAGNERDDGDCGMSSTPPYLNYANVGPPMTAKNVIAVGATNSNDDSMTDFSSWGPLDDGRLKPDVVAPGCESTGEGYIRSTLLGDVYGGLNWCGTSMAAPAVSGISGLIIEQFRTTFGGGDPLPSTVKALLIHTAVDLDDGTSYYNPGPDYASGYGRIDAQAAVDGVIAQRVHEDQVSHGQTDAFTVNVPAFTPSLKVTLAWDDEPGAVNANPALVNNLDLVLVEPNGITTHLPWVLDPANPSNNATIGTDSVNNVEQVQVDNPTAGTWEVRVVGTNVPVGPQVYSLVGQTFTSSGPGNVGPLEYNAHSIDDDNIDNSSGNDDGIVNPGETIEMFVELLNAGTDQATDVYATISTSSPYVTFIYNDSSEYGNIPGGGMATNFNDFDFEVSGSAPNGHVIHFDLDITASNGGPWSDGFDVTVVGDGGGSVALISDQTELQAITSILDDMGLTYDVVNNNWNGSQGIYTSDYSFLSNYGAVVWYASGYGSGRNITQQEHDALEQFLQAGGRLLVTGYDTLGSPTDLLLADLVRSSSSGDGPFTYDYTITDGNHPITDGPYGSFPAGTTLTATYYDHDQAEADTGRGAITVAELSDGHDKIMATELASDGIVVYWNGNDNVSDWTGALTTLRGLEEGGEQKRDVDGRPIGSLSIENLRGQALRAELADNPPEANYGGSELVWYVSPELLSQLQTDIVPLGSENVTFPATGDTISVTYDPYWWNAGDYAQGSRTLSLSSVNRVDYNLSISYNSLSGSGHVDFDLYINGIYVGSFTVWPGEYSKSLSFSFYPISEPVYTIRLEETNTVDPGMGSISIPLDTSSMTFFGPSTEEQVAMLKNTLHWLQGIVFGDPHEPNDSPAECTPIFFDVPITDPTIDPAGDDDYYCFTGGGGQVIAADIDAWVVGSPLDPVLTLFDSDGATTLAENDDYGGLDSYLEYTLPHDGTFYLRVRSFGHPNYGGPDYIYSILLTDITPSLGLPFFDDMESGPNGWWAGSFWHQVEDGVSPYPKSFSPIHSWWYGQDATGDYDNGAANAGSLTTPPIEIPPGAQVELSFWQWYETEPMLLPQSVYFDAYHGNSISSGNYTDWADDLTSAGYSVIEYNQPIDLATLSGHQVLAIFRPTISLSTSEIAAINAFMQNGGRVVVLGEWNDLFGVNSVLNALTAAHGITLNNDIVHDSTDNDGEDFWPLIYNFADHPLVRGVNAAVLYASCSLSLSGPAVPLATGDGDATAMGIFSTAAEDVDTDGTGIEPFVQPQAIVPGAPIVMAYGPVGEGELIAIGDSDLWAGSDPDGDGEISLEEYFNVALSRRAFGKEVDHSSWDQKWVQISADGGPFQNLLQVTGGPMSAWHQVYVDLSPYAGNTVRIRYHFDTIDSLSNNFRGWYLDDVRVDASDVGPVVYDDHIIDDDNTDQSSGDGDGIPDADETVELYVELRNNGADAATNVQACITEDSPYVNGFLFNTCSAYGDIPGGGTAANGDDFDFTIDAAAPSGHTIHFDLVVTADNGGPWSVSFDIVVGQGATVGPLIYVNAIIDDDNDGESVGNGDGQINPGEVIELYVEVGNTGNATASSVQGCISEHSPYLDGFLYNTCSGYGNIPGGGTATSTNDFDFEVDINAPGGHLISLCMDLSATNGGPWTTCFELPVFDIPSGTALRVEPPDQDVSLYIGPFHADVVVEDVSLLGAFQFDLVYDPAIVRVDDVDLGPFLGSTGCSVMEVGPIIDNVVGRVTYGGTIMGVCAGPSGDGVLATVTFHPEVAGESDLILENEQLMNTDNPPAPIMPVNLYHGHVTVTSCFFADVDCDDDVDIVDIFNVAYRWGCQCGDTCYEPAYDLNDDCSISISDIQIVACYFGWPSGDFSGCYAPSGSSIEPMPGQPSTLRLTPEKAQVWPGESFTVAVGVESVQDLAGFEAVLHYDPQVLRFDGLALGDFLTRTGNTVELREAQVDADAGTVTLGGFSFGEHNSPEGSGTLITLTFTVQGLGTSPLTLSDVQLARRCGLAHASPTVVSGHVTSGRSLYLPLIFK